MLLNCYKLKINNLTRNNHVIKEIESIVMINIYVANKYLEQENC